MNQIGDNNPPSMAVTANEVARDLSGFMSEHPIVANEDEAREAKLLVDRASLCIKDLEDERKNKTAPLNEQVEAINGHYRGPRELLKGVINELKRRFDAFLLLEESKRIAAAAEAKRHAGDAEARARSAEEKERETLAEADSGVAGLDVAAVTADADAAFAEFEKAQRAATLAERETYVRIGGGFRRSASLRNHEILYVYNAEAAVATLGLTEDIEAAIIKSARAYKKLHKKLPAGVSSDLERKS